MPKSAKARLDHAGLTGLGLDKLVEILLDEAAFNKALKSRLLAALAGGAGAGEVARLIDTKLDSLQKSRGYLSPTRANTPRSNCAACSRPSRPNSRALIAMRRLNGSCGSLMSAP
jgi:hypothetical protein